MSELYLITGFLGSGKTTFLKNQLSLTTKRVGVLMNEFGKISMDTFAIESENVDLVELKNGSIFCSCLKEHFIEGLAKLIKMDLDVVFIESSGLADPSDMGKVLRVVDTLIEHKKYVFKGTICMIDGLFFKQELEKMVNVRRQIEHAHHIVINKTDLITLEQLSEIVDIIKEINPQVGITNTSFGKADFTQINMNGPRKMDEESTNTIATKPKTMVLEFKLEPTMEQLNDFLTMMTDSFYRIKGFVMIEGLCYKVDQVNAQIEIKAYNHIGMTQEAKENINKLVFLTSRGISSIAYMANTADKYLNGLYTIAV